MAEIVRNLFGVDPAMLQQQQADTDFARAFRFAQLDPFERANMALYQSGAQLARGTTQLLGGDEQLQRATQIRQLASQFDLTTPEGLDQYAQAVAPFAPDVAAEVVKRSSELKLKTAQTSKALREQRTPTSGLGKLLAEKQALLDEGVPATDPRIVAYDNAIKAEGEGKGVKVILPGEQQDKILREQRTKKLLDLEDSAISSSDTLQIVRDFNNVLGKSFTGVGAGAKLTAAQFANALGVTVTGTTESEQLDQLFAALTLGQAKNLKGALSDKDLKFLREAVGTRGLTKETLQSVVDRIERNALIDRETFNLASSYTGDMARLNINEFRKEATAKVNDIFAKRKRRQELLQKAGQPTQ